MMINEEKFYGYIKPHYMVENVGFFDLRDAKSFHQYLGYKGLIYKVENKIITEAYQKDDNNRFTGYRTFRYEKRKDKYVMVEN